MILHLVCKVDCKWPNSFFRTVFTSEKNVAIDLGNLGLATWQLSYGTNVPCLDGRLVRYDIHRMKHEGVISKSMFSGGRGRGGGGGGGGGRRGVRKVKQ